MTAHLLGQLILAWLLLSVAIPSAWAVWREIGRQRTEPDVFQKFTDWHEAIGGEVGQR